MSCNSIRKGKVRIFCILFYKKGRENMKVFMSDLRHRTEAQRPHEKVPFSACDSCIKQSLSYSAPL